MVPDDLAAHDALNEAIWSESPHVQASIQEARSDWLEGQVGAQQAMCGIHPLPWVPDLVGADSQRPGSVVVVGMAYSGFVRRVGRSRGELPADRYRNHKSAAAFCAEFARSVVPAYPYYGNLLAALPAQVGPRRVVFTDLCRVALVRVGAKGDSSSGIERADRALYCRYAEHPLNQRWHERRLVESRAHVIVALGHVAEHGLLRLLRDRLGCAVEATGDSRVRFTRRSGSLTWCTAYAHDDRQVGTWAGTRDWWRAAGPRGRWAIVTIPHTSESEVQPEHVERIRRAWHEMGEIDG
jgi:hypothetical protein